MLVTCPSGLTFQARPWKIGDRRHLHDRKVLRQGLLMRKMLECIDEGVDNPGPYEFEPGKPVPWNSVCFPDIIDALVSVRIITKPVMEYDENCQQCGGKIPLEIDLRDLERLPMNDAGKLYLSTGEAAAIPIETGDEDANNNKKTVGVKLKMFHGSDMSRLANYYRKEPKQMQEIQMVMHLAEVDTSEGAPLTSFEQLRKWYADQPWDLHNNLDDAVAAFTGGVHTLVGMTCDQCNAEQEASLPFAAEFYYPKKKRSVSSMATF